MGKVKRPFGVVLDRTTLRLLLISGAGRKVADIHAELEELRACTARLAQPHWRVASNIESEFVIIEAPIDEREAAIAALRQAATERGCVFK